MDSNNKTENMNFPKDFVWGTATSAYQIEGAAEKDGKGPSIWDAFSSIPGKVNNQDNGNTACDHYNMLETDIQLLKDLNVSAYRFSISWARILPDGRMNNVNIKGIEFYNKLINQLIEAGITPWVTLYHWDLPLALQLEEDGWLGENISNLFADYAEICFSCFGDRVKNWITINEAWVVAILGYGQGVFAPGRQSKTEPYLAGHHLLLAHAKAVKRYRESFQSDQGGRIGITNNCDWREPKSESFADKGAAERALEFFIGWFADPIYKGDYPAEMKKRLGDKLPKITSSERELIMGSSDFFGLNHYTTMYTEHAGDKAVKASVYGNGGISEDQQVNLSLDKNWKLTEMKWAVAPWGCQKLLEWIAHRYNNPEIYITENGCAYNDKLIEGKCEDQERVEFIKGYINACSNAIKNGVNLKGYFLWSLMDNFEWAEGYSKRFGIHYVDFQTLKRTPKSSAKWYSEFIKDYKTK